VSGADVAARRRSRGPAAIVGVDRQAIESAAKVSR